MRESDETGLNIEKEVIIRDLDDESSLLLASMSEEVYRGMLADEDFDKWGELADLAMSKISNGAEMVSSSQKSLISSEERVDQTRSEYLEPHTRFWVSKFPEILKRAINCNPQYSFDLFYQNLNKSDLGEVAEDLIFLPDLDDKDRLKLVINYANAFGFIKTVDAIGKRIKITGDDEERTSLMGLYSTLQGEEVNVVRAELSEVYQSVDFGKYALNSHDVYSKEADQVVELLDGDKNPVVLDAGAGTGGLSVEIAKRGIKVVAIEYEGHHVDQINQAVSQNNLGELVDVKHGSWFETGLESGSVDLVACLNRTEPHNRTPFDKLRFFAEMARGLKDGGKLLVDYGDIGHGVYNQKTEDLRRNLARLGLRLNQTNWLFDGPDEENKFNRQMLSVEQVSAMAGLVGMEVVDVDSSLLGDHAEIGNLTYVLQKNENFDSKQINRESVYEAMRVLGFWDPGGIEAGESNDNLNMILDLWGLSLGQLILYAGYNDVLDLVKQGNENGRKTLVQRYINENGQIEFVASVPRGWIDRS